MLKAILIQSSMPDNIKLARKLQLDLKGRMKKGLLDDWAFGHVIVTAVTFEADYAFLGLGYVNVSERVASSFSFVYAP